MLQRPPSHPPVISIAMATYNGAAFLRGQLDSFAGQSLLPDELVITDDGSSDATAQVVADFAAIAPFAVRFVRNDERLGFNGNFARAIDLARGEIIFISDQDDLWYPDKIATVAARFDDDPRCLCVVNDQMIADEDGHELGRTVLTNVRALGKPDSWYGPGCCTAFRRALLGVLAPFPGNIVAYDHWINGIADGLGVRSLIELPLQSYRRHTTNASGSVFARAMPTTGDLVRAARTEPGRESIARKVGELDAIAVRLDARRDAIIELVGERALDRYARALRQERAGYAQRAELLRHGAWSRFAKASMLYARGGYRDFNGIRTALKDIVAG